jgi:two-component system alkaline phosphatase synthesis response regulator PhoP
MKEYSVVIIDDDIWMQRILSKTLEIYGFKISYLASNGYDGIALAVDKNPDLIILDILMPELTGHMTLKLLKKIKYTKNIPVLMVSALSNMENLGKAVKIGTSGFISKPFTKNTVYDKLVEVFGKENLNLIQMGKPIDMVEDFYGEEMLKKENTAPPVAKEAPDKDVAPKEKTQESPKKILQFYQDDEQKSIESIKKLLLKKK